MVKELGRRDKGRLAQWLVVIEFCLSALRDELQAPEVSTVDNIDALNEALNTIYGAVGLFRIELEIE